MIPRFVTLAALFGLITTTEACKAPYIEEQSDASVLKKLKDEKKSGGLDNLWDSEMSCFQQLMETSKFDSANFLLEEKFGKVMKGVTGLSEEEALATVESLGKASEVAQKAIAKVGKKQEAILDIFQKAQSMNDQSIPKLTPSLKWAQSLKNTLVEVKFATRNDLPACLNVYDHKVELGEDGKTLKVQAMCKNDGELFRYVLDMNLFDAVTPFDLPAEVKQANEEAASTFKSESAQYDEDYATYNKDLEKYNEQLDLFNLQEKRKAEKATAQSVVGEDPSISEEPDQEEEEEIERPTRPQPPMKPNDPKIVHASHHDIQSAGRLYLNLTKEVSPRRWNTLEKEGEKAKKGNQVVWWELHDKYINELVRFSPFDTDDEEVLERLGKSKPSEMKKEKKKGKKHGKKKKSKSAHKDEL